MEPVPDPGYNTYEEAVRAQRERTGELSRPAHGGYPGEVPASVLDTDRALGRSRATCPDCRVDYVCPFHRTH